MTGNPFEQLMAIDDVVVRLKSAIKDLINNLPQNPAITPINSRCFTISSKDLLGNWSPFYHDFKSQAEFIASAIDGMEPGAVIPFLKRIVSNHSIEIKSRWYKFHPMFCNNLKTLISTYGI